MSDNFKSEIRDAYEREVGRHPAPPGLRQATIRSAVGVGRQTQAPPDRRLALVAAMLIALLVGGYAYSRLLSVPRVHVAPVASPAPAPSRTPIPSPTPFTSFFPADDTTVTGTAAYGRVQLPPVDNIVHVRSWSLSATFSPPSSATVYRIDTSLMPSPVDLAVRVGGSQLQYRPDTAGYWAKSGSLVGQPANAQDASDRVARWLGSLGLLPPDSTEVKVSNFGAQVPVPTPAPPMEVWRVEFIRHLDGLRVDYPATVVTVDSDGNIASVSGSHRPVAGGSSYPLRSVASAWGQVRAGHFYDESGVFNNGAITLNAVAVDSVYLVYHDLGLVSTQPYYVPMYVFTDSTQQVSVYYPAITDQYLDWTVPQQ